MNNQQRQVRLQPICCSSCTYRHPAWWFRSFMAHARCQDLAIRDKGPSLAQRSVSRHLAGAMPRSSPPNGCFPLAKIFDLFSRPSQALSLYWLSSQQGGAARCLYNKNSAHRNLYCLIRALHKTTALESLCPQCFASVLGTLALH
jgi:hypothetical protein